MSYDLKLENGNLKIASNGDLEQVKYTDKLVQDVLKLAITPLGANQLVSWYGSSVGKTLIGEPADLEFAKQITSTQLASSLEMLKLLQTKQMQYQNVAASEAISRVLQVYVGNDKTELRQVNVIISVLTRAGVRINPSFVVHI